ncbi:hypothetical protein K1T71_000527 [Dendrolimus kikuchii]|uniref:Uncharacterized protein n=1 Tax=Dendrolimus kikuchii TaxID=765133 RepID=A0ACC1DK49_9NEOP|nr:hypothetical protein K1T71_000527 [Dendrolimus kikuchii]
MEIRPTSATKCLQRKSTRFKHTVHRLSSIVQGCILTFFGHITRREDTSVERLVVQGKMDGKRARRRSPMRWTDQVKTALNGPLHECTRKATVREIWRRIVKLATTSVMRTTTTLPRV